MRPLHAAAYLALAIAAGGLGLAAGIAARGPQPPTAAPPLAPPVNGAALYARTLPRAEGGEQALAEWRGRPLVVNLWATWCPPCREEMPELSRIQQKFAGNGVQFVGIALDSGEAVRAFLATQPVTFPLLLAGEAGPAIAADLGNPHGAIPYTIVFDRHGNVRHVRTGRIDGAELEGWLAQRIHDAP